MADADITRPALAYGVGWTVAAAVGAAIAGAGAFLWVLPAASGYLGGAAATTTLRAAAPGIVLVVVGVLVFKVTSAILLYRTLSAAFAAETANRLNTEAMKSDILSVLDDRLADMKQDTLQTRRVVERVGSEEAADAFDFPDER